jgi:hypothetical protein
MLVDLVGGIGVVGIVWVGEVFGVGTGSHQFPFKVNDFGGQSAHSSLEGLLLGLVVGRIISGRRFGLVISGPWPWPTALLDFDGFGNDVGNDVSLFDFARLLDMARNVDQDVGNDRGVQIEDGLFFVVFLGGQTTRSLVKPERLDLRVLTSSIAFDVEAKEGVDT